MFSLKLQNNLRHGTRVATLGSHEGLVDRHVVSMER